MSTKGLEVRWEGVCYEVPLKSSGSGSSKAGDAAAPTTKLILDNVFGSVRPGEVLGIFGPSGCGKTSLLNILAGRKRFSSGKIAYNGEPASKNLSRVMGYVKQEVAFFEELTVRETLRFASKLLLPMSVSAAAKKAKVEKLMDELNLRKVANSYVGKVGAGISGGERRRLAVAIELLNDPLLLFMDEPTSGLDSWSALKLVQMMKHLAVSKSQTIVCTIHQPRASILPYFDKILLLAEGKVIYFGAPFPDALEFFASAGHPCPQYENLADFMLDLVNVDEDAGDEKKEVDNDDPTASKVHVDSEIVSGTMAVDPEQKAKLINDLVRAYKESVYYEKAFGKATTDISHDQGALQSILKDKSNGKYPTPVWYQFWVVFVRSFLFKFRNPGVFSSQAVSATLLPLIIGSLYWNLSFDQSALSDRVGAISFVVLLQSFMAYDIILIFPLERSIYLHEHQSGWYSASAFYWGRSMAELPFHMGLSLLVAIITYFMFGLLSGAHHFFFYVLIIELSTIVGASMLMSIGSFCKNAEVANLVATLFLVIFMLFNGFQINLNNIPSYYRWLAELSFLKWAVGAALSDQLSSVEFSCENGAAGACIQTGQEYLDFIGMGDVDIWYNVGILVIMIVVYRFLAYIGLRFMHTGKTFREVWNE